MSIQTANQIAKTAELFGQDDDITVLTRAKDGPRMTAVLLAANVPLMQQLFAPGAAL